MKKTTHLVSSLLLCVLLSTATACASAARTATVTAPPTTTVRPLSTATTPPTTAATATAAPSATATLSPTAKAASASIITTGAFFSLSVADLKASDQWYTEKLGLTVVLEPPKTNGATVVVLEGGGLIVELVQVDGSRPLSTAVPGLSNTQLVQGIVKVGAIVENFDQTLALLRARQVNIFLGPYPASASQRANVIIKDNEGNLIQFFGR